VSGVRIVSYNILEGGGGRTNAIIDVIEKQRPDVVALAEADSLAALERMALRLKMDYVHAPGNKSAVALLSRWPIRQSINHALLRPAISKGLLEATVVDPQGSEWTVGVVHLHAHAAESDEQIREREIADVLDALARHRAAGRPHVLCGDFNANSPVQQIDPDKVKPSTREEMEKNGGVMPRRVIQALLDAGYLDSLDVIDPQQAATSGTFSTEQPGQRVDFLFTWGMARDRIRSAWIEYGEPAKDASDHYPVGANVH
jgi:endonuclease/exonuclease/phosphatase family metal-dependent hydrolase